MSNLVQRLITGVFLTATLIVCVTINEWVAMALFFIITLLSLNEFYTMTYSEESKPNRYFGTLIGTIIYLLMVVGTMSGHLDSALSMNISYILFISLFIVELYRKNVRPVESLGITLLGIIYVALPYAVFIGLGYKNGVYNYELPLGFLLLLWSSDSLAYVFGRWLGKHKLFERISPKKTWEGFIGALISNMLIAFLISGFFISISPISWMVVSLIIVCCGTLGDLVESMFKRSLNIKDSGSILPGHGGMLDRFDGLLIAVPIVYFFIMFCS
jgi:phosphatidate cytidylyltransferase